MRNDARPIGEDAHGKSPVDARDPATHDSESAIVNQAAEEDRHGDHHDTEPTMPAGEPTLGTKI